MSTRSAPQRSARRPRGPTTTIPRKLATPMLIPTYSSDPARYSVRYGPRTAKKASLPVTVSKMTAASVDTAWNRQMGPLVLASRSAGAATLAPAGDPGSRAGSGAPGDPGSRGGAGSPRGPASRAGSGSREAPVSGDVAAPARVRAPAAVSIFGRKAASTATPTPALVPAVMRMAAGMPPRSIRLTRRLAPMLPTVQPTDRMR